MPQGTFKNPKERAKKISKAMSGNGYGFKKGHSVPLEWREKIGNENNYNWRGNKASYSAVHHWVIRWKGKPTVCEGCGKIETRNRFINWANIDHTYKRLLDDYIRLCVPCHKKYDLNLKLK